LEKHFIDCGGHARAVLDATTSAKDHEVGKPELGDLAAQFAEEILGIIPHSSGSRKGDAKSVEVSDPFALGPAPGVVLQQAQHCRI
jgi:hypothetical protein